MIDTKVPLLRRVRRIAGRLIFTLLALAVPGALGSAGATPPIPEISSTIDFCSSCHGPDGRSTSPQFPRLAGQRADYIAAQLQAFRNDTRTAPHAQDYLNYLVMWGLTAQLNAPTTDAIAAYYASQTPASGTQAASAQIAAGARIYAEGVPSQGIPACVACHGPRAQGSPPIPGVTGQSPVPRLAGQYQAYLARQLEVFRIWARQNVMMHTISVGLTPEQIDDVTAYLATL